jgi:hypothetical protein
MSRVSLFAFHPELFEHRTLALEALAAHDLHWFEHFSSVDLLHDLFGLEVCGIIDQRDAELALCVLQETFPEWSHSDVYYRRYGRERGWKALIHKHRDKRRRHQHT